MADHHVRVILEAVDKGSKQVRSFFGTANQELDKYRRKLTGVKEAEQEIFLFGGGKGTRGKGGRFEVERNNIEKATIALQKFKKELQDTVGSTRAGAASGGFLAGLGEEREVRRIFDERKKLSKQAIADEKQQERDALEERLNKIREFHNKVARDAEENEIVQIKARQNALAKRKADEANFLEDVIRAQRRAAVNAGRAFVPAEFEEIRQRIDLLRQEEDQIKATRDAEIAALKERLRIAENAEKSEARKKSRETIKGISPQDDVTLLRNIREEVRGLGQDLDGTEGRARRFGTNAGRAFGQFRSGLRLARNGLNDTEKELLKTSSAAERFGARLGNAVRPAGAFRTRILLLIGALQILGTLLVQFGAALVAVASSAIMAGAALGGALLAGVTQLIPAVGLLAAAFSRLGAVMDAANLADKLQLTQSADAKTRLDGIRDAVQRLADARFNLVKAGEAVGDAEYDLAQAHIDVKDALKEQREAVEELADARKQAARDIIDANLEEREAALALEEAELGVLEAKRRLREEQQRAVLNDQNIEDAQAQVKEAQARLAQARAEGDEAEVTVALQQLSAAEQSLQQIKADAENTKNELEQAQIDVKQANLAQDQAAIRNKRAKEDAAKARKDGVEGSDRVLAAQKQLITATRQVAESQRQVVQAERSLRDSVRAVAVAKREEADAERGLTDARNKATAQQEQLQQALGDLSPAEKRLFKSIQRIKDIYKKNFRPITDIIIDSFSRAIDTISVLLEDPKILNAAKGLATAISSSVDKIADFAISPEFKKFIEFSLINAARNVPKLTDGFIDLGRVLIRVARAATPLFNELIDRFVAFLDKLEDRTKNPEGLNRFFETAGRHLDSWIEFGRAVARLLGFVIKLSAPAGKGILDDLTAKLNEWSDWMDANEDRVREFFRNVRVQVGALAGAIGKVAVVLFKAFSSESASELSIFILNTVIPAFALFLGMIGLIAKVLNTIFSIPFVGPLAQEIVKFAIAGLIAAKVIATIIPLVRRLSDALKALWLVMKSGFVVNLLAKALVGFTLALKAVGIALRFVFITNPWIAVIAGIIAAIVLLDRKFHFIKPTIQAIGKAFQFVFNWVKKHWKLLLGIVLGPFGLIVLAVIKWRDKIIGFFKAVIDWVKNNWKLIVAVLLAPFAVGGVIILGILKFKDKILGIFKSIPNAIVGFFKNLPENLKKIFDKIPGLLKDALKGLGGIVKSALSKIPGVGRFFGGGQSDDEKIESMKKEEGIDAQDVAKINRLRAKGLSPKEIIIKLYTDQGIDRALAGRLLNKYVFAAGGTVPGSSGAVPIIAHAGEWVLNEEQQNKLSKELGTTKQQAAMWLFGTKSNTPPVRSGPPTRNQRPSSQQGNSTNKKVHRFADFNLVSQTDPDGVVVWFIEMADGAFGQVSSRDALKIIRSNGTFIPGYVKRSTHGFIHKIHSIPKRRSGAGGNRLATMAMGGIVQAFANGGIVHGWSGHGIQSFADGGIVLSQAGIGATPPSQGKSIEQNFNVTTQGESDWNYIMRIGAMHAQGSYT